MSLSSLHLIHKKVSYKLAVKKFQLEANFNSRPHSRTTLIWLIFFRILIVLNFWLGVYT